MSADPMSAPISTPPPAQPSSHSGFALLIATMALVFAIGAILAVAFKLDSMHSSANSGVAMVNGSTHGSSSMMGGTGSTGTGAATGTAGVEEVNIVVKSDEEHAKLGPEGTWHDAFLPADFSVDPGATVKVTVLNYDEGEHSFTAPMLGLNVVVAAGTSKEPKVTTFTFTAPARTGSYMWFCAKPCDPWAMAHDGYMRGFVSVA
jgi:plastocyanin